MYRFSSRAASALAHLRTGVRSGTAAAWSRSPARGGARHCLARPLQASPGGARRICSHTPAVAQASGGDGGGGRSLNQTEMIYVGGLAGSLAAMLALALAAGGGSDASSDPAPEAAAAVATESAPAAHPPAAAAETAGEDSGDTVAAPAGDDAPAALEPTVSVVGGSKIVCDRQPPKRMFTLEEVRADHGDEVWVVLSDTRGVYNVTYAYVWRCPPTACCLRVRFGLGCHVALTRTKCATHPHTGPSSTRTRVARIASAW